MTRIEVNKFDTSTYSPTHSSQYNNYKKRLKFGTNSGSGVLKAMLSIRTGFNADRDPAFNLSADPDPAFYLNADPDPRSQTNADRRGSGSWSEGTNLKS
jgi:hypothetical protein